MASTSVSLIVNATANTSALRATANELRQQKQLLNQLASAERQRAAAARAAAAQQRSAAAAARAAATGNAADQSRAATAAERARAATASAELAARRHRLAMTQVTEETTRTGAALQRIGSAASSAGSVASSAFSRLADILSGIATTAAGVAVAIAGIGTAGLASGLNRATGAEVDNLMSASNLGRAAGGGLAGGQALQKQLSQALLAQSGGLIDTSVSKSFANTFADDVINAFGSGLSSINMTAEMANNLATLATIGGAEQGQLKDVVIDFVSGALTNATLDNRDVLNNTGLTRILKQELEKSGKALENLNPSERIALLDKALKTALPVDLMQELSNTAQGQMAILKNRLFGEQGLFSVMRDVFPDQGGEQTVFSQFKRSLGLLFNSDGVFAQLGRILEASGISTDLMRTIFNGWERLNQFLLNTREFLFRIRDFDQLLGELGGFTGIGQELAAKVNEAIASIDARAVGEAIGNVLNGIGGFLRGLDWGLIARQFGIGLAGFLGRLQWDNATAIVLALAAPRLGQMLAQWLIQATGQALAAGGTAAVAGGTAAGRLAAGAAAGGVGLAGAGVLAGAGSLAVIGDQLGKLLDRIGSDSNAQRLTTGGLGLAGANRLGGAIDIAQAIGPQDRQRLIEAFTGPLKQAAAAGNQAGVAIGQIVQTTLTAAQSTWNQTMTNISTGFSSWSSQAIASFNSWVSQTVASISNWASQTGASIQNWVSQTISSVTSFTAQAIATVTAGWSSVTSTISAWMASVSATISSTTAAIVSTVQSVWTAIQSAVSSQFQAMQSTVSSLIDQIVNAVRSAWDAVRSKVDALASAANSLPDLGGILSSAFSSIQSALQSLQSQASSLIGRITGADGGGGEAQSYSAVTFRSGSGNVQIESGAIVINAANQNPEQIAEAVMAAIDQRVRQRVLFQGV